MGSVRLKREGPGRYSHPAGYYIEKLNGEWFLTYPGERTADAVRDTLWEVRELIAAELRAKS